VTNASHVRVGCLSGRPPGARPERGSAIAGCSLGEQGGASRPSRGCPEASSFPAPDTPRVSGLVAILPAGIADPAGPREKYGYAESASSSSDARVVAAAGSGSGLRSSAGRKASESTIGTPIAAHMAP
jgi:hypothetical protein